MIEPRREISDFIVNMEYVLQLNDHKGGWQSCDYSYLMDRIAINLKEMRRLYWVGNRSPGKQDFLMKKATDIANFAMMIYDNALNARNF